MAFAKRIIDALGAGLIGLLVLPLVALGALVTWLEDRESPWFRQSRLGRGGRIFELLKIRSMVVHHEDALEVGQVGSDHPLVTTAGCWLRRFKVDELPQIWHVLTGEMSLVGPRPALPEFLKDYSPYQRRRLECRPGLTGWAQVNGNVQLSWDDRILLDVWYIDHWSLWLDVVIILKTFRVIIGGEVANPAAVEKAREYAKRIGGSS